MDHDTILPAAGVILKSRSDWPYWYAQLELLCRDKAIWDQINPDGKTVKPIDKQEPAYPDYPVKEPFAPDPPVVAPTPADGSEESDPEDSEDDLNDDPTPTATAAAPLTDAQYELAIRLHPDKIQRYKIATSQWNRTAAKLSNVRDWIIKTVHPDLMAPASIKLLNKRLTTPQALVRVLKDDLAPTNSNTMHLVRQQYRAHLEKARSGRMSPDKWFNEWQVLYGKAQAFRVPEIEGQLALIDFLDALSLRLAPEWARTMRQQITLQAALGKEEMSIDDLAKVFTFALQEQSIVGSKGKSSAVFATFGGGSEETLKNKGRSENPNKKSCPCRPAGTHSWEPIACRRLQTAVSATPPSGSPRIKLTDFDKSKIKERLEKPTWNKLRELIKEKGWNVHVAGLDGQSGKFPGGLITAALIDPIKLQEDMPGVYSTAHFAHPLSASTILDSGGAIHLVNDRDLLVPGTFRPVPSTESVDAGTQSLPVSGVGQRLLRNVLHGKNGSRSEDLLLKEVKVVEGFHVNIVSSAKLEQAGIWYLGLDHTLRYGSLKENVVLANLHTAHNLVFMEFKKIAFYSDPINAVQAIARSDKPRHRADTEEIWHRRSGHLGKRALQALVKAAQNVEIQGTTRLECEHCAITHAAQVISRRPKERSPRPFYRISWDLFDMPTGRLYEQWAMILKDDYSGKLYNENLQSKTLDEIMRVWQRFERRIRTKYQLPIVEIYQDGDTATRPWRGRSRFEEWTDDLGIQILTTPANTHQPNGSAERAGQEIITKAIKMRASANLPAKLWPLTMDSAAFLHGMSPSPANKYRSPNEVLDSWFRQYFRYYEPAQIRHRTADLRPDWSGIFAYGCRAYPLDRDRAAGRDKRGFKVNPRGHIGYLVGYKASNIYAIWVPTLDQVITTRDVTFDEARYYQGKDGSEMPKDEAVKVVEILHDGELDDPGQDIDIPEPDERQEQSTQVTSEQELGGEPPQDTDQEPGLAIEQNIEIGKTVRGIHKASDNPGIRAGHLSNLGLATPEQTPDPIDPGVRSTGSSDQYRLGSGSQQGVHPPVRAGPPTTSERIGSPKLRLERPTRSTARTARAASVRPDEVRSDPPQRLSRRLRGAAPEINQPTSVYMPLRKKKDRGDQVGGGSSTTDTVNALIADLSQDNYLWADLHHTFLAGLEQSWLDRSSYETLNAVVMAASLNRPNDRKDQKVNRVHRDDLASPPTTWKQVLQHPLKHQWFGAAENEIKTMKNKGTWTEVPRAEIESKPLPLKWVFTYKFDQDGFFIKCKARIVVRGDLQEVNSLSSTYAATLAARSFRTAMAIAAQFDLEILQWDVVGAFLNALISADNPVVCEMPDGFRRAGYCVKLNRALYGLKESPLLWYEELSGTLRSIGLLASKEEPCLFFDKTRRTLILFYVDDILLMFHKDHEQEARSLWSKVLQKYEIQEQGQVAWFLGVRVLRNREDWTITLVHDTYIDKITKRFNLNDGSHPPTPLPSEELVKNEGEATKQEIKSYQEKVGSALYTAIMLRPDIAYAVSKLSHFLTNPSTQHFKAIDRVIMYLYRTRTEGIQYGNYNGPNLTICGDASFADDPETRRSSHGYIVIMFGGPILWKAARQSTVTTSTTEAELLALEHVTKETVAIKRFFDELTLDLGEIWNIWCDNQQTIRLVIGKNERITTRLRHVDIQNMWLRQEYAKGQLTISYLETEGMPADGLTKSLTHQKFDQFKKLLNITDTSHLIKKEE
jgi:hypothetical protein